MTRTGGSHSSVRRDRGRIKKNGKIMKSTSQTEYRFDYANSKPNRFAGRVPHGAVAVLLDPDVARVFRNAESVNAVLRA